MTLVTYVLLGSRCLLAVVFLASFAGKVRGRARYAGYLAATRRLTPRWALSRVPAGTLAAVVVAAEAAVPLLLAVPALVPAGLALSIVLLSGFAAATAAALRRGDRAPCHCFGSSQRRLDGGHVVRDAFLAAVAVAGIVAAVSGAGPLEATRAAVVAAVSIAAAVAVLVSDTVADVFRPTA
jgi:methylamine utilization protein MauE